MAKRLRDTEPAGYLVMLGRHTGLHQKQEQQHRLLSEWQWKLLCHHILALNRFYRENEIPLELLHIVWHLLYRLLYLRQVQLIIHVGPRRYKGWCWSGTVWLDMQYGFENVRQQIDQMAIEKAALYNGPEPRSAACTLRYALFTYSGGSEKPLVDQDGLLECVRHINWHGRRDCFISLHYQLPVH